MKNSRTKKAVIRCHADGCRKPAAVICDAPCCARPVPACLAHALEAFEHFHEAASEAPALGFGGSQ